MTVAANVTRFLFAVPSVDDDMRVVSFSGQSSVSEPFRCDIEWVCENSALNLQALIGKSGVLTFFDEAIPTFFHGEILDACQLDSGNRFTTYRIVLGPKLRFLDYRINQRIFQQISVPDIIVQILDEAGIRDDNIELALTQSYSPREYCTQYQESDLAFISRLMQEEGIYYYFEHHDDRHVMVISDNNIRFQPIEGEASIRFKERTGMVNDVESIYECSLGEAINSGQVSLRDYYFEKPQLRLEENKKATQFTELEQYHFAGGFNDPEGGKRYASMQLAAHQAQTKTLHGTTDSHRFYAGHRFTIHQHPLPEYNIEYLLLKTTFWGRQPQSLGEGAGIDGASFSVDFVAIPSTTEYRAKRNLSPPKIHGTHTAFVTGPNGEEIYTDAFGRIKVQFHWDREGEHDESSSCWVRVCQSNAGSQWGSMVIPRIGQEVIVSFLDGNPDRPIVTGTLYNAASATPYELPAYKTKTVFKSMSTPGGDGFNELRIEDKKDNEQVYLHAEKDLDMHVQNEWKEWIGKDQHITVGNNQYEQIGSDLNETITSNHYLSTGKSHSSTVGQDANIKIDGSHFEQAGKDVVLKAGMTLVIQAGVELTLKAGGGLVKLDPSGVTIKGPMVKINSGGSALSAASAQAVAPEPPTAADQGSGPGKASAPAAPNTSLPLSSSLPSLQGLASSAASTAATSTTANSSQVPIQAVKAKDTAALNESDTLLGTLVVAVIRSDIQQGFANAAVKIKGPSGTLQGNSDANGTVTFTDLNYGSYTVSATLPEKDAELFGNPTALLSSIKPGNNGTLDLVVGVRTISFDICMLNAKFTKHNHLFDGMLATLKANGKTYEGTIDKGELTFEVPTSTQSFDLTFEGDHGITYTNTPKS